MSLARAPAAPPAPPASSSPSAPPAPLLGYGYAAAVLVVWVGFSLAGRHAALAGGVRLAPWDLAALRYLVALGPALVLLALGWARGLALRRSLVLGLLGGLLFPLPAYVGFTFAPAAHGAVILSGTLPFMVALGTWALHGERWGRARLFSLAVLLAGIALLGLEAYGLGERPGAWRGDALFTVSAACWAVYTLLARRWAVRPGQAIVAAGIWSALVYLPVWWLLLPSTLAAAPRGEAVFQGVFQGLFGVVISLFFFTRALALLGPVRLTLVTALVPGLAGLIAIPLLGERMGPTGLGGLALVSLAVALGVRPARPVPPHSL